MARRADLDLLKGIAIIAIIFYHLGILPYGYLGVDIFLVIGGFLIVPPVIKDISTGRFCFFSWLCKRFKRFLPLVVIVSAVALIAGYFVMMPDDYENLAQSAVATDLFANNILLSLTTKDYWATANEYKPLLAMWYLGLVGQFFVCFPLVMMLVAKLAPAKDKVKTMAIVFTALSICSLAIFLSPFCPFAKKYYFLPFRIWEFGVGAAAFYIGNRPTILYGKYLHITLILALSVLLAFFPTALRDADHITVIGAQSVESQVLSKTASMVIAALLTAAIIIKRSQICKLWKALAVIGRMSLSLFVWHQLILAFLRYTIMPQLTAPYLLAYLATVFAVSLGSYRWLERIKIGTVSSRIVLMAAWAVVFISALYIYKRAGVVRDVPEMGVTKDNPCAVRNTEYIDRIYWEVHSFTTSKPKVLIIGNSFARDFGCCLMEWDRDKKLEISYLPNLSANPGQPAEADYVFIFERKDKVPEELWKNVKDSTKVYGIGTKYFGKTFGNIYICTDGSGTISRHRYKFPKNCELPTRHGSIAGARTISISLHHP